MSIVVLPLFSANNTVTRLDQGGCVVGLLDKLDWEQGIEHLGTGDILIAYSDGVTEPENDFGEFGEARLLEVVRRRGLLPFIDMAYQGLGESLEADRDQPPFDRVAMDGVALSSGWGRTCTCTGCTNTLAVLITRLMFRVPPTIPVPVWA